MTKAILFYGSNKAIIDETIRMLSYEMDEALVSNSKGLDESKEYSLIYIENKADMNKYADYSPLILDYTNQERDYAFPHIRIRVERYDEIFEKYWIKQLIQMISQT